MKKVVYFLVGLISIGNFILVQSRSVKVSSPSVAKMSEKEKHFAAVYLYYMIKTLNNMKNELNQMLSDSSSQPEFKAESFKIISKRINPTGEELAREVSLAIGGYSRVYNELFDSVSDKTINFGSDSGKSLSKF